MAVNAVNFLGSSSTSFDEAVAQELYSGVFNSAFRTMPLLYNANVPGIHKKTSAAGSASYQFLTFADISDPVTEYDSGDDIVGQDFAVAEGSITHDKYIQTSTFIRRDQLVVAHFDVIPQIAQAHARKIGMEADKRIFATACLAARQGISTKNGLNVHNGGNFVNITAASVANAIPASAVGAANFKAAATRLARLMDEDEIPEDQRLMIIRPEVREAFLYDAAQTVGTPANTGGMSSTLFSKDYQSANDLLSRRIRDYYGFNLLEKTVKGTSNGGQLPDENITTGPSKYRGNWTVQASLGTPVALVLAPVADGGGAVSIGTWESARTEMVWMPDKQGWLFISTLMIGCGVMNPWGAGVIEVTSS